MVAVVREKTTRTIARLDVGGVDFFREGVRRELSAASVEEMQGQIRRGNPPSRIVVDRRSGLELDDKHVEAIRRVTPANADTFFPEAQRRIQSFYGDLSKLADAVEYAHKRLVQKIPHASGTAAGLRSVQGKKAIYFWCSDPDNPGRSRKFENTAQVRAWLEKSSGPLVNVRILGPTIEYRRFVTYKSSRVKQRSRWVGLSRGLSAGKAIDRYRFTARHRSLIPEKRGRMTDRVGIRATRRGVRGGRGFQVRVADAIHNTVANEVKRQYRDLMIGYRFTRSREDLPIRDPKWRPSGQNIHIPQIFLGIRDLSSTARR